MIIVLIFVWALLGIAAHWIGWKLIDECRYDVTIGQCLLVGGIGPIALLAVCGCLIVTSYQQNKFIHKALNKVVFAKEEK